MAEDNLPSKTDYNIYIVDLHIIYILTFIMIGVENKQRVISIAIRMTAISINFAVFGERLNLSCLVVLQSILWVDVLSLPFLAVAEYD